MPHKLPPDGLTDHDKINIVWNDHFQMKDRLDRLYWLLPFISFLSIIVGAVAERFGKWLERLTT